MRTQKLALMRIHLLNELSHEIHRWEHAHTHKLLRTLGLLKYPLNVPLHLTLTFYFQNVFSSLRNVAT